MIKQQQPIKQISPLFLLPHFPWQLITDPQRFNFFVTYCHNVLKGMPHSQKGITIRHAAQGTFFDNIHL